ncbi:MAG: sugar ABC transporter substrate-binding protein [Clostridiales bacterium]|jgi:ribose transport system substrate-binding protein|nr:sugar ABC transporter substrate-binding protein [Clostridiales bacterium]
MKKLAALALTLLALVATLVGCATREAAPLKVGFALPDLSNEFFANYGNSVKAGLEAEGYEVTLASYGGEVAKATEQIETFTTQGVDLFIIMGATPDLQGALKAARAEGVKVLLGGNEIEGAYDVCLVADNKQMGALIGSMGAEHWKERLKDDPEAEALVLLFSYSGVDMKNRSDGIYETFKAESGIPEEKLRAIEWTTDSGDTTGRTLLENAFTKYPNIKMVLSISDAISLTAMNVMKASGKTGDEYAVYGSDATIQSLLEIAEVNGPSIYRGTVSMGDIVAQTLESASKLLKNEYPTLPYRNEGPGVPVTAENVSQFLPPQ